MRRALWGLTERRWIAFDFMKTCSKCKRELELSCFWSWKGKPNAYPSCRECEGKARIDGILSDPVCRRCKERPHTPRAAYCYPCQREMAGKGAPKWVSRRSGLEWCKLCEQRPKLPYHQYCFLCKRDYQNRTRTKRWADRYSTEEKSREVVRKYATNLVVRGKIKRGPCVFCGRPGVHFHHYDYFRKTRNFEDVCLVCHVQVHRFLEIVLTLSRHGAIRLPVA